MKPVRYLTYLVSALLMIAGIYLMTDGRKSGLLVGLFGAYCSHIGRPPSRAGNRPFLPVNRWECILGLLLIATVPLFAYVFLTAEPPPIPVAEPHPPLSPFAASVAVLITVLLIGAKFRREKRNSEQNAAEQPATRPLSK